MKRIASLFSALVLLSVPLAAQVGPGWTREPGPSWIIINSVTSAPGTAIRQVFHVRLPGDAAGDWTTCLTVENLPTYFGGDGKSLGVVMGTFNPLNGTFRPNIEAKALNSGETRWLYLDPSGLYAIFERPNGIWFAKRSKVQTPFGTPVQVSGLAAGCNPSFGMIGKQLKVFYTTGSQIVMQDFATDSVKATGPVVAVSGPAQTGAKPKSPTPIHGVDGDVEGLWFTENVSSSDSDEIWAGDLDPSTPPVPQVNKPDWMGHGGVAGGVLSFSHDKLPNWHIMHSEAAWMLGDVESLGGTLDLTVVGVPRSLPAGLTSVVFASATVTPGISVPGINGKFGLGLATFAIFGVTVSTDATGIAAMHIPVINDSRLKGLKLPMQAMVIDPVKKSFTFTNTTQVEIR